MPVTPSLKPSWMFASFLAPAAISNQICPVHTGQASCYLNLFPRTLLKKPFHDAGPLPALTDATSPLTGSSTCQSTQSAQRKAEQLARVPAAARSRAESASNPHRPHQPPRFLAGLKEKTKVGGGSQPLVLHRLDENLRRESWGHSFCPLLAPADVSKSRWMPWRLGGVGGIQCALISGCQGWAPTSLESFGQSIPCL